MERDLQTTKLDFAHTVWFPLRRPATSVAKIGHVQTME